MLDFVKEQKFFGLKPNESGFFTAIGFDPENSPYKDDKILNFLGDIETIISKIASSLWEKKTKFY